MINNLRRETLYNIFTLTPNIKFRLTEFTQVGDSDCNIGLNYDREKYKEILLDAAETSLWIFGFDRTSLGKSKDKRWWMELRQNRMNDVRAEAGLRCCSQQNKARIKQLKLLRTTRLSVLDNTVELSGLI